MNLHSYLQLISLILSSSLEIFIQTKSSEALGFFSELWCLLPETDLAHFI